MFPNNPTPKPNYVDPPGPTLKPSLSPGRSIFGFLLLALLLPMSLFAQEEGGGIDTGDTSWILVSTALVLFMNIPGLALFYAGLVRGKNVLSVLMHCFTHRDHDRSLAGLWLLACLFHHRHGGRHRESQIFCGLPRSGHAQRGRRLNNRRHHPEAASLCLSDDVLHHHPCPHGWRVCRTHEILFCSVVYRPLNLIVYAPICHMVWGGGGGYFADKGVQDFAGGIVVHITAGIGALVACIVLGPRKGYPNSPMMPHNLPMTVTGAAMLWVGWFGFNGGSALGANGDAASALVVTQISASVATLVWMAIEWMKHGKPSMLGAATGAIAGLAAITPASGTVGPLGALVIGAMSGSICWYASTAIKQKLGYDDSLDVFGVHGVGGFIGTIMLAVFMADNLGGVGYGEGNSMGSQLGTQVYAALFTAVYTAIATWIILKVVSILTGGIRVDEGEETTGLDQSYHGEEAYND